MPPTWGPLRHRHDAPLFPRSENHRVGLAESRHPIPTHRRLPHPRKHPIITNPGLDKTRHTWTYHRPLQTYIKALAKAGFLIDALEEWPSHKKSQPGPRAQAENSAREEIPMFLAIRAVKP